MSESINSNGSGTAMLAAHFGYDPFGNLTAGTVANATAFPFRFSTKPQDPVFHAQQTKSGADPVATGFEVTQIGQQQQHYEYVSPHSY
ncbi:MAG: hypothetical protein J0M04_10810 [Verrucomicrobia bacterium]|nr:hypothetical protein [Verrucomicrobiota bacterium]